MRRLGTVLLIMFFTIACDKASPVAPTGDFLTVNPLSVHMKVGDTQTFVVNGNVKYGVVIIPENSLKAFNVTKNDVGVVITYVRHYNDVSGATLGLRWSCTKPGGCGTEAKIFLDD